MKRHAFLFAIAMAAAGSAVLSQASRPGDTREAAVDAVFSRWSASTPGCAVGVAVNGQPLLERAYGMADLEHDVANAADTIFEAGSVSKQFTAAAVLLLAREGKLSLDDEVRKHVPELPDYGVPLTIRHMLTHTSGLRDWGELAAIAGWPRGKRAHTHAHVLDIVSRQKALNFPPGTNWSYSNTGFNLAAIIVSRVSGQSFAEFSRERIFKPLGMIRTSWRDDYTRIVKHRAIAYEPLADGFHEDMPFENVHGNGGLLTTVADLLKWNENFVTPKVGDAAFVREQQTVGRFTDGRPHEYALGLYVRPYRGVPEVSHSGSTAGYRAYVSRYPAQHLSVAVLCNAGDANATQYAHSVAETYLGAALKPDAATTPAAPAAPAMPAVPTTAAVAALAGTYVSDEVETEFTVEVNGTDLFLKRRPDMTLRMRPAGGDAFTVPSLGTVTFRRESGKVTALSVRLARVWDLRFTRK